MHILLSVFAAAFIVSSPMAAQAQGHNMYCEKADSTAALQECLKRHLASAQKRLNMVYQKLSDKYEGEEAKALSELQRQWLAYRDAECTWEAEQSQTPVLKRANELSCMARVTDDRADIISTLLMDTENPEQTREYGSFPRWMNVVSKEKGTVFWDYRNRMRGDLNCDGEDEHFMVGLSVKQEQAANQVEEGVEEPAATLYNTSVTLAIASYPSIGRPQANYIELPVLNEEGDDNLCDPYVSLQIEEAEPAQESKEIPEGVAEDEAQEGESTQTCAARLVLKDKKCAAKSVVWTGKSYALDIKQSEITETEKSE